MLRADWNQLREYLSITERIEFAKQFIAFGMSESNDTPHFVIGIISNAAAYLPV
jgi:hypothetical protein